MLDHFKHAYMPDMKFPIRTIDPVTCSRCGRCVDTCPCGGFTWTPGEVPAPVGFGGFTQACINCHSCTAVCPTGAIRVNGPFTIAKGRYQNHLTGRISPPNPFGASDAPEFTDIEEDLTDIERMIYQRRSNRIFRSREVPRELITRVLEAGRFAPSAGNGQPYHFVVITDPSVIRELETRSMTVLRLIKNAYLNYKEKPVLWKKVLFTLSSWLMVNKFDPRPITAMEKADKNDCRLYFHAPVVILILKNSHGISNPDLDAGICTQTMTLAAHALKLGTCVVSLPMVPLSYPIMAGFRKKIGIRPPFEAVTSIALGYPKGKIDGIVARDTPKVTWVLPKQKKTESDFRA